MRRAVSGIFACRAWLVTDEAVGNSHTGQVSLDALLPCHRYVPQAVNDVERGARKLPRHRAGWTG